MAALDTAALLADHCPVVQYDSLETYYTDWAAVITDRPGSLLKRADGTVLAVAGPPGGALPQLELSFLGPQRYANGEAVAATDYLVEVGSDYVSQARQMHARPGYANRAHGRAVEQAGVTWLQYWFFMYYDDPGFLDLGTHEGDVEMIQMRLAADGTPDAVSYAQHRSGVSASWAEVEQEGPAPVVYSSRGTHASMLRRGTLISDRSFLPDHNDAKGPRVRLELVALSDAGTPWAFWPGHWGGTKPEDEVLGQIGVEATSPAALPQHTAWRDPAGFHAQCEPADLPPAGQAHVDARPAPPAPQLSVQSAPAGRVRVSYALPAAQGAATPTRLVVGLDASGGRLPPATTVVHLTSNSGTLEAPVPPGAGPVQVRATAHSAEGTVSPTATAAGP